MKVLIMLFCLIAPGLAITPDGHAAIYKYVDKDGMIGFADDLQSVPEQYRAAVTIVSGKSVTVKKAVAQDQPQVPSQAMPAAAVVFPVQANAPTESGEKSFFSTRIVITLIVVVSSLFASLILGILDLDHKKAVKIARMSILWGMSVYLIYAHAGDVFRIVRSLGTQVSAVQSQSAEKGKRAGKAIKAMNELKEQLEQAGALDSEGSGSEKQN